MNLIFLLLMRTSCHLLHRAVWRTVAQLLSLMWMRFHSSSRAFMWTSQLAQTVFIHAPWKSVLTSCVHSFIHMFFCFDSKFHSCRKHPVLFRFPNNQMSAAVSPILEPKPWLHLHEMFSEFCPGLPDQTIAVCFRERCGSRWCVTLHAAQHLQPPGNNNQLC